MLFVYQVLNSNDLKKGELATFNNMDVLPIAMQLDLCALMITSVLVILVAIDIWAVI